MIFLLIIINQAINFEELYNKATTGLVQFRAVKDSAMQRFIALGKDSLLGDTTIKFLVSKFDTKSAPERHTLKDILKKIGKPAIRGITKKIGYRGSDDEARALKQSLWVLSEIGTEEIVEPVAPFIYDDMWQIRSSAYTALGKSKSIGALPYIKPGLRDSISMVRKSAYYALAQIATPDEIPYLLDGLADRFYGVRYAAVDGLANIGKTSIEPLVNSFGSNEIKNYFIAAALARIGASEELGKIFSMSSIPVRNSIYRYINNDTLRDSLRKIESYEILKNSLEVK